MKNTVAGAPPEEAPRKRPHAPLEEVDRCVGIITTSIDDDKGENIVVIDLAGRASFADRMIVASGLADRQITAMAQHIERKLRDEGLKGIRIEGANGSDWVLIDAGDIVVHLFKPEAREMYGLEEMWAPQLDDNNPNVTTL